MGSELILIVVIVLLGVLAVETCHRILGNTKEILKDALMVTIQCPPHSYSFMESDQGEYLQCTTCNFIPGQTS